jgi:hypothetical protein
VGKIRIIEDEGPDIFLTADEYARLKDEYQKAFMFYAGSPPTFEQWVRQRGQVRTTTTCTL